MGDHQRIYGSSMKKLLLMFLLASVTCFAQNVKIASPSTPSQNIVSGITVNNSTNMVIPGSLTISNDFSLTKGAVNNFIWTCTNANGAGAWLVNSGTNSIPGSVVLTNNVLFLNAITNVTSVGGGTSLRNDVSNNIFFIKSLLGSNGVTIVDGGTNVTIVGSGGGASTLLTTNITTATGGASLAWEPILQLTTTATTGNVVVSGQAFARATVVSAWVRIRDANTNKTAVSFGYDGGNTGDTWPQNATLLDTLTGSTKTYVLEVASNVGSLVWTNQGPTSAQGPSITNGGINITILQVP